MRNFLLILWGMLLLLLDGVAGNFGLFPVLSFYFALYVAGGVSPAAGCVSIALISGIMDAVYSHSRPMFLIIYPVAFAVALLFVDGAKSSSVRLLVLPGGFGGFTMAVTREFLLRIMDLPGRGAGVFFAGLLVHVLWGVIYFPLSVWCLDLFSRYLGWRQLFRETEDTLEIRQSGRRR